ncbi:TetR/AcrR family transcriptional regulator [Amycolatopsis sp. K13G38]|uniref:TetR/AcrR family transcriptional regulator n=1 Tax=Amycolatopsis acididurans TaxID=2724524 RepID=A0ABX1IWQ6_9PSEU|nr:TetR/AcrR family transcriptional regulator [Amycolatopsis acididurans]NKQ51923.1 TetR/AcrR family transcriptional regulator [Amycolatopsis acididurans]
MAAPHSPPPRAARLSAIERREQLARLAARRFHELGYHRVSLNDVATEAGVTGPAVYRHFRNKEALLAAAITSGMDLVEHAVTTGAEHSLEYLVSAVADVGLHRTDMWILLQRESRFLGPELGIPVQEQFGRVVDLFSRRLRRERPDLGADEARLLVTAATAVLSLPSTTRTSLVPGEYRRELIRSALACLRADPAVACSTRLPDHSAGEATAANRREQVIDTAIDLFFRRGYSGVSLDDIGAAVGLAGPSILHHFSAKADILVAAFERASSTLAEAQARRRAAGAPDLSEFVSTYIAFSLANRTMLGVYVSEQLHLPAHALDRTRATIRIELGDWTRALLATSPGLDDHVARVRVRAALSAINDLVRVGHFARRPRIAAEIAVIAEAVLDGAS